MNGFNRSDRSCGTKKKSKKLSSIPEGGMKVNYKRNKKGFTIVELVIVIAVIAILAAVLIPTFASLIKKANLSSDKQAVREMNMALTADEKLHGEPQDIETVMRVLANAGYNSDNWVCLSKGYEVYWVKNDNLLVLYNSTTAEVEYPDNIEPKYLLNPDVEYFIYNNNNIKALQMDFSLSSGGTAQSASDLISSSSGTTKTALEGLSTAISTNEGLKSALGMESDSLYVSGTREVTGSGSTYASMVVMSVNDTDAPVLKSNGELKENVFYISTSVPQGSSAEVVSAAQKQAAAFVYTVFAKVNSGAIESDVSIVLPAGTVIDASANEWQPIKYFTGYFGTTDPSAPVIIDGARLTGATGYSQTVRMNGSESKYFMTGFFGTVYGNATIENVTFKNIKLDRPARDYVLTETDIAGKLINNRNTIGIIGGITNKDESNIVANVVLRNINVESSCEIVSQGCAGGLVGYIGSIYGVGNLKGTVTIENCNVAATVASVDNTSGADYGPAGGIVGFFCRCGSAGDAAKGILQSDPVIITIKNCSFTGKLDGYRMLGTAIGNLQTGLLTITNFKTSLTKDGLTTTAAVNTNGTATAGRFGGLYGTKKANGTYCSYTEN